ncbi:RICIN domain-containing protein [Kitasatospora sp. NPDC096077]|uniref:RICIN domain-containing protein n=1 Tax=Kitasatospora sp. NPDC096077 TaxID=3155544 RepID=UPI00332729C7
MRSTIRRLVLAVVLALGALLLAPVGGASADTPATSLRNQASDRCPDGATSGTLDLHPCGGSYTPGQWTFFPMPGQKNVYMLNNAADHRSCLASVDGRVHGALCAAADRREWWEITPYTAPGQTPQADLPGIRLRSVADSGARCMDNTAKNFGGWKLYLFDCNNGPYQQWNISRSTYRALFGHPGLSWTVLEQRADNVVHVGGDATSNPYQGDTPGTDQLPVLCLAQDGRPAPAGVPTDGYHSWARGEVRATEPVHGTLLTSRARADQLCATVFGAPFRMAEFHDGQGWSLWANGTLPTGTRFWTAIDDQEANPWN